MDSNGDNPTNLTRNDAYPVWSPDRRRIAFVSTRDGNPEVYVMGVDW
jgi:Tol biopolymer transport system component